MLGISKLGKKQSALKLNKDKIMFARTGIVNQSNRGFTETAILKLLNPSLFYSPRQTGKFQNLTSSSSHFLDFTGYSNITSQTALTSGFRFSWDYSTSGWNANNITEKYFPQTFSSASNMSFFMYIKLPATIPVNYVTFFSFRSGSSPIQYDFDIELQKSNLAFFSAMRTSTSTLYPWISDSNSNGILNKTCLVIYRRSGSTHNLFVNNNTMLSYTFTPLALSTNPLYIYGVNEGMRYQCFGFCNYSISDSQVTSLKNLLPSGL
jgi:hypothetical protein